MHSFDAYILAAQVFRVIAVALGLLAAWMVYTLARGGSDASAGQPAADPTGGTPAQAAGEGSLAAPLC